MRKVVMILLVSVIGFGVVGCARYYRVKEPTSGNMYYTKEVKQKVGGTIMFKDARTGNNVTLQNSELERIPKQEFEQALRQASKDEVE